ncbi:hypothetical protein [uncultured Anaerococcus sp.]|uniref:hypothetical protein n=1 Tax=uncultured Anaerococcus sp. TaxID=293428 RepID=UPI0026143E5B|nr:hypothetical protein [uncultured Anaerococcus sp.]
MSKELKISDYDRIVICAENDEELICLIEDNEDGEIIIKDGYEVRLRPKNRNEEEIIL